MKSQPAIIASTHTRCEELAKEHGITEPYIAVTNWVHLFEKSVGKLYVDPDLPEDMKSLIKKAEEY
jgi:hypothetical protein